MADGYVNLGHAESLSGEFRAGLSEIQHGLALLQSTIRKDAPADKDVLVQLGTAFIFEGEATEGLGDEPRALQSYEQAVATFSSPAFANRHELRLMNANALAKVAGCQARLGHYETADDSYRRALATVDVRPDSSSISVRAEYTLISIYTGLGDVALRSAERPDAGKTRSCEWYQRANELWSKLPVRNSVSPVGSKVPEFETVSDKLANCK